MEPVNPAVEVTAKTLIEFCDKYAALGELYLEWDGGNDSGSIHLISATPISAEDEQFEESIVQFMDDTLDYGSWCGDFSANGKAIYNVETKTFEGANHYCTTEFEPQNIWFEIGLPTNINFKYLYIEIGGFIEDPSVVVYFNHLEKDEMSKLYAHAAVISENLKELLKNLANDLEEKGVESWNHCLTFDRSDFNVDAVNNVLEIVITQVDYAIEDEIISDVEINLAEMLKLETE